MITVVTGLRLSGRDTCRREPETRGVLTYMIPADAPPSFEGHRESTYAMIHSVAPFYGTFIEALPQLDRSVIPFRDLGAGQFRARIPS